MTDAVIPFISKINRAFFGINCMIQVHPLAFYIDYPKCFVHQKDKYVIVILLQTYISDTVFV